MANAWKLERLWLQRSRYQEQPSRRRGHTWAGPTLDRQETRLDEG